MLCRFRMVVIALVVVAVSTTLASTPVGAQTLYICAGEQATIVGTDGDDILRGTSGPDVIVALEGNDIVAGLGGDDIICGGRGNDQIYGGPGRDVLYGSNGNDTIFGAYGPSVEDRQDTARSFIFGGNGNDVLYGSNQRDRIDGGSGDDVLRGFEGSDTLRGGAGTDTVVGGPDSDDMGGGTGRDTIFLTDGDSANGGVGRDRCNITNGEPNRLASCGQDERETVSAVTVTPPKEPEANPAPTAPAPDLEPDADPLPLPAPPPAPPVSILQSGFALDGENGTEWEGRIYGAVPVDNLTFSARQGRCFLIVGELTPTVIPAGIVSRGFEAPTLGLIAGGENMTSGSGCDTTTAEALGYTNVFRAEATLGTTVPVYRQIFVPAANTAPITGLFVRGPLATSSIVEPATALDELPAARSDLAVGSPTQGLTIGFDTVGYSTFEGAEWDVDLVQVVESAVDPRIDRSGRCFLVLGTLTPTVVTGRVNSGFETPRITGIVEGRHIDEVTLCDSTVVEEAGFEPILSAQVPLGQVFPFFSTIFVPEHHTGPLSQVIVGRANFDGHLFDVAPPTPV